MSALHPVLARKGRFAPFLSLAVPLAAVLTGLLARPGAFRFGEAASLAWLLAFVSLFLYLSVCPRCPQSDPDPCLAARALAHAAHQRTGRGAR